MPAITLAGETVHLLPERALHWAGRAALIVSDVHWGKAASFRAGGVAIPGGTTTADLGRLDGALDRTGARRLVVLGDLFHDRAGRSAPRTLAALREWRARRPGLEILLVRGNHDRAAGDPPPELAIECVDDPHPEPPFVLAHHPTELPDGYTLAGHVHPAVRLVGRGRLSERLPCFLFGPRVGLLPSFGSFTGSVTVEPGPGDRVFVVAGEEVVEVTPGALG